MNAFKSWLVANLEIVYYLGIILIIGGAALFLDMETGAWGAVGILTAMLMLVSVSSIKYSVAGLFFAAIIFGILLPILAGKNGDFQFLKENMTYLIVSAAVALVVGILIAIYAYRNFDDTVSRRFLYRNSSVSVYEEAWKYAFNRWFAGFMLIMGLAMEILAIKGISSL